MINVIYDTIIDAIKLLPFLFLTFLLLEYIEHKAGDKSTKMIERAGNYGPVIGSLLGSFPQCGFSAAAANLYAARIITVGTLIAICLSTSDEMLPILISEKADPILIIKIITLKIIIGMIFGLIIDSVIKKIKKNNKKAIADMCEDEHCDCEHGIFKSSIKHSLNILLFIFIISLLLNISLFYLGEDNISKIFMKNSIFGSFISSLIGLIPNCGASVMITELYLNKVITFGSMMGGLLTGSGVALLILFKINKDIKENIKILVTLYVIGAICGLVIDVLGMLM